MGLFDDLKKLTKGIGKEIEKSGVKDDFAKFGKEIVSGVKDLEKSASDFLKSTDNGDNPVDSSSRTNNSIHNKNIPELYNDFPRLEKNFIQANEIDTNKYTRISMYYKDITDEEIQEYIYKIESSGYIRMTDVRFEKGNTYIIVDPKGWLNIVFHIKK